MDRKTLQYMTERTEKARAIVDRIGKLTAEVERVKRTFCIKIHALGSGLEVSIGPWDQSNRYDNSFRTELAARMVNVFIDMTLKEIVLLEAKLAEL